MKNVWMMLLFVSVLGAGIVETKEGTFLEIYSEKNRDSSVLAKVSTRKGKIDKKTCFNNRMQEEWCRVVYTYDGIILEGYSDKKSLDIITNTPNTKLTFEKSYGGKYDDEAKALLVLENGFLLVGKTQSFGQGNTDTYIIKTDKFGNELFWAAYGGRNSDEANAVVEVEDGFMIAGTTSSFGNRVQSLYLAKIAQNGNLLWQKGYYSDKDDYYVGNDLIKINKSDVLVMGVEEHVAFFDSEINCYLNAMDSKGQRFAIKRYGGEDIDRANSVVAVEDGYVFAGETETWGHGDADAYVVKIDKDGNRVWHNAFGFNHDERANQIIATKDGGFILVGTTDSSYKHQKNIYVVKIRENGTREWHGSYGYEEDEEGFGIVETDDGYVLAGYSTDTKNYDSDVYLLKLNKNGDTLWNKRYGGTKDDKAYAIAKTEDGFAIAGYTTSSESYSKDVLLLRVDNNGDIK
ncbi:hypothetical protein KJ870_06970 [bacterium]|nr:hypothetical protein [bacterium]MBU1434660.1 hypothetical protein [bacterium]MBU1502238.1 hypothetical protein [bacterium]